MVAPRRTVVAPRCLVVALAAAFALLLGISRPAPAQSAAAKYLADFEFVQETVARRGAAVASKKIPWERECARMRPRFARCESDADHVRNLMELLATLHDSHTGVVRHAVDAKTLPSKWDGLYGGGLWIGWDEGLCLVQGMMEGHTLAGSLPLGSVIAGIGGEPAWLALERERRRIGQFQGISSDASLFASLSNRLLPFGERQRLDLVVLNPEGKFRTVAAPRWGPGGRAFDFRGATMPPGVSTAEGAVSAFLATDGAGSGKIGYLRITGGMDGATAAAFHRAFDALRGMDSLLLDGRGMGGGGDSPAWEMAGRLFPKAVANGSAGMLSPSGEWQFDGPVVYLQDELEVSSAETFTWAVSETERVVSVGRPTGGWSIIPTVFDCPSGLVSFRLGVTDRGTPIRGLHTEGTGWPPDIRIPYGPGICARPDPVRDVGLEVLRLLRAGVSRDRAIDLFAGLFDGKIDAFRRDGSKLASTIPALKSWDPDPLARLVLEDLRATLRAEVLLLEDEDAPPPDALGAARRLEGLRPRAKAAGLAADLGHLEKAVRASKRDADAQAALLEAAPRDSLVLDEKAKAAYLRRHGKTRLGKLVADWK